MPKITTFQPFQGREAEVSERARELGGGGRELMDVLLAKAKLQGYKEARTQDAAAREAMAMRRQAMSETSRDLVEGPGGYEVPETPFVTDDPGYQRLFAQAPLQVQQYLMALEEDEARADTFAQGLARLVNEMDRQLTSGVLVDLQPEERELVQFWKETALNAENPEQLQQLAQQLDGMVQAQNERQGRAARTQHQRDTIQKQLAALRGGDKLGARFIALDGLVQMYDIDAPTWERLTIAAEHPGVLGFEDYWVKMAEKGIFLDQDDAFADYQKLAARRPPAPGTGAPEGINVRPLELVPDEEIRAAVAKMNADAPMEDVRKDLGLSVENFNRLLYRLAVEGQPEEEVAEMDPETMLHNLMPGDPEGAYRFLQSLEKTGGKSPIEKLQPDFAKRKRPAKVGPRKE
jgi:hypothetical protein